MLACKKPRVDLDAMPDSLRQVVEPDAWRSAVGLLTDLTRYACEGNRFDCNMDRVNAAWTKVYAELEEVGLAYEPVDEDDGGYLHQIRLEVAWLPSARVELGYVYEGASWQSSLGRYEEGVIYLPSNKTSRDYVPGGGLVNVIRHEYAHAWHWLEPEFFETGWFEQAFGGAYVAPHSTAHIEWFMKFMDGGEFQDRYLRLQTNRAKWRFLERCFAEEFVTAYAASNPREDFAETFRVYLRFRKNLEKFRSRPGVYRKLKAVEQAVGQARDELGLG